MGSNPTLSASGAQPACACIAPGAPARPAVAQKPRHPAKKFSSQFLICACRFSFERKGKLLCGVVLLTNKTAGLSAFCIRSGVAEFPLNHFSATPSLGRSFFSAEFESVFCTTKCATKRDVAIDPPNPCASNDKELHKDSFTFLYKLVIIIVSKKTFRLYSIHYNVSQLKKICQTIKLRLA